MKSRLSLEGIWLSCVWEGSRETPLTRSPSRLVSLLVAFWNTNQHQASDTQVESSPVGNVSVWPKVSERDRVRERGAGEGVCVINGALSYLTWHRNRKRGLWRQTRVKRGSSNLPLVFLLHFQARVEFKSSGFDWNVCNPWSITPIKVMCYYLVKGSHLGTFKYQGEGTTPG